MKPNYGGNKRRKEEARKKKQEDKRNRRLNKPKDDQPENSMAPIETPVQE